MSSDLDLVADVGNTRVKLALFEGSALVDRVSIPHGEGWVEAADAFLAGRTPARAGGASVAPAYAERVETWLGGHGVTLRWLGRGLPAPVKLAVEEASGVGADRIANAAWAITHHPGRAVVLFDLGTAITLDAVDAQGRFRGGAIAAGVALRARALHEHTALLPEVRLGDDVPPALGKTTVECLQGGLFWGTVGLIDVLAARARVELEAPEAPLVLTGGDAHAVAGACRGPVVIEPDATLLGVLAALRSAP